MIYIIKDGIQRQFLSNGDRIFDILRLCSHHLTYWKHMGFRDMLSELEPKSVFSDVVHGKFSICRSPFHFSHSFPRH